MVPFEVVARIRRSQTAAGLVEFACRRSSRCPLLARVWSRRLVGQALRVERCASPHPARDLAVVPSPCDRTERCSRPSVRRSVLDDQAEVLCRRLEAGVVIAATSRRVLHAARAFIPWAASCSSTSNTASGARCRASPASNTSPRTLPSATQRPPHQGPELHEPAALDAGTEHDHGIGYLGVSALDRLPGLFARSHEIARAGGAVISFRT